MRASIARTGRSDKRVTGAGAHTASDCRRDPKWEPYAGKLQVRVCGGAPSNGRPYRRRARKVDPARRS
jgi:hypothetical protein